MYCLAGTYVAGCCWPFRERNLTLNRMKLLISLVSVVALDGGGKAWRAGPARHLLVGQYRYDIVLKTEYAHDDDADNTYFIVTRANSRIMQCSAFRRSITRQGVLNLTGTYAVNGPYLLFKERYGDPQRVYRIGNEQWIQPDSTIKTFSPDQTGRLQLIEVRDYTGGVSKKKSYR